MGLVGLFGLLGMQTEYLLCFSVFLSIVLGAESYVSSCLSFVLCGNDMCMYADSSIVDSPVR